MLRKSKKRKPTSVDSLIGQNSQIIGDFRFRGGLHIDGVVKGNVLADEDGHAMLTLSDRGTIEGEVKVPFIILNGVVKGDVHAREHVELASSARVEGNVYYGLIEMAMGAEVNGNLLRISEEGSPQLALGHGVSEPIE
uniref:Integral membrane protein ccma involved in cell shape determination n=1 Tax=uncultured Chromatiales bacterium HF0200_41F04 TaxID=710740 RepID=E0XV53_9GAMM|nr:integral membrane protein ccma involved in cell shape determination [uncultured Chromatiales bacterium HF0200_41F04]